MITSDINRLTATAGARHQAAQGGPANPVAPANPESYDPARVMGFKIGLGLLLIRFGMLHQLLGFVIHFNVPLLYFVGVPVVLFLAFSGGIQRAFRGRPAYYWTAYALWMAAAVPFSIWRGGSFHQLAGYWRSEYLMLFVIAGLTTTWRECHSVMRTIAWGGVICVACASFFKDSDAGGRLSLAVGTVANANDYACVLLLLLPFILWLGLSTKTILVRAAMFVALAYGVYAILATASRGAALGLVVEAAFFFYRGTIRQRIALAALVPLMLAALVAIPSSTLQRLRTFTQSEDTVDLTGAAASFESRQYVLRKGIEYTIANPIFGVGPGEFPEYEGRHSRLYGMTHGSWLQTHNTFLQVSSECGIPALLFFVAGLISSYRLLSSTYRKARQTRDCEDIRAASFFAMLGLVGFCVGITFLSFAYYFYEPALGGLAIAISSAAEREFEKRNASAQQASLPG